MDITIFKNGRMIGPMTINEIAECLRRGEIAENDLAQRGDQPLWVPLRLLLDLDPSAPLWRRARREALAFWQRFWFCFNAHPFPSGLCSLALAGVLLVLVQWPFLLFGPPLVGAVFAGAILINQRRFGAGIALVLGAVVVPVGMISLLHHPPPPAPLPEVVLAPDIQRVIPTPPPATPIPLQTFGGLALPQPARPSPTPAPKSPPL